MSILSITGGFRSPSLEGEGLAVFQVSDVTSQHIVQLLLYKVDP